MYINLYNIIFTVHMIWNKYRKVSWFAQRSPQNHCKNLTETLTVLDPTVCILANLLTLVFLAESDELFSNCNTFKYVDSLLIFLSWHSCTPSTGHYAASSILPSTFQILESLLTTRTYTCYYARIFLGEERSIFRCQRKYLEWHFQAQKASPRERKPSQYKALWFSDKTTHLEMDISPFSWPFSV